MHHLEGQSNEQHDEHDLAMKLASF